MLTSARHSRSLGMAHLNRAPRLRGGYALAALRIRAIWRGGFIVKPIPHPKNNAKYSYFRAFYPHIAVQNRLRPIDFQHEI